MTIGLQTAAYISATVLFILALFSGASSEILQGAEGEVHQEDGFVDIVLDHLVTEVELGK